MPPGDIPVEASEVLAFTPASMAEMDGPPVFTLRAITHRDQRHHRRLMREEGLVTHGDAVVREKTREALKALWSPEDYEREIARIEAYWHALDDWSLQRKADPDLRFEYDSDEAMAINRLIIRVRQNAPELSRIYADNEEAADIAPYLIVATVVQSFDRLDAKVTREAGYLTYDGAAAIREALDSIEKASGKDAGLAWLELLVAALRRSTLSKEEAKNSASPSPSARTPKTSTNGTDAKESGKSPASAKSGQKTSSK